MNELHAFSPYIREVRIWSVSPLYGEWSDLDNVFTYIKSGEAAYIMDGQKFTLREGQIILLYPFRTHIVKSNEATEFVQYIFHFDIQYRGNNLPRNEIFLRGLDKMMNEHTIPLAELYFRDRPFIAQPDANDRITIEERFPQMYAEYLQKREGHEVMLKAFALEFLAIFLRSCRQSPVPGEPMSKSWRSIEQAVSYIHKNHGNKELGNDTICAVTGLTPNYLSHIFKEHLGVTLHQYLNQIRIKYAKRLMVDGTLNFTEIADAVGFNSLHIFSKTFKRITHQSPSEYLAGNLQRKASFLESGPDEPPDAKKEQ